MRTLLSVFNSSEPNLKDLVFTIGALEGALAQTYEAGVPSNVSHDMHRPVGWARALALYLEPGLTTLAGLLSLPETVEDEQFIERSLRRELQRRYDREAEPHLSRLRERLAAQLIGDEAVILTDGVALRSPGLAARVAPDLFLSDDSRHGLVLLRDLAAEEVRPGVFVRDGLLFFAHQYFRRSLSHLNPLNEELLRLLRRHSTREDLTVTCALDPDLVGLETSLRAEHIELEYWWGPKFKPDLGEIHLGVSVHKANERDQLFFGLERTEFWWQADHEGGRSFECEEVLLEPTLGTGPDAYGCRYAHSMLDEELKTPVHLDGAIRHYDVELMLERYDKNMNEFGKSAKEYTKLWRVDGPLALDDWKELLTHHFKNNHLIGEYFGGQDDKDRGTPRS